MALSRPRTPTRGWRAVRANTAASKTRAAVNDAACANPPRTRTRGRAPPAAGEFWLRPRTLPEIADSAPRLSRL
jgi:hypothetical protein